MDFETLLTDWEKGITHLTRNVPQEERADVRQLLRIELWRCWERRKAEYAELQFAEFVWRRLRGALIDWRRVYLGRYVARRQAKQLPENYDAPQPDRHTLRVEQLDKAINVLTRLPEAERTAVMLLGVGLEKKHVAQVLGMQRSNRVDWVLRRALTRLHGCPDNAPHGALRLPEYVARHAAPAYRPNRPPVCHASVAAWREARLAIEARRAKQRAKRAEKRLASSPEAG